MQGQTGVGIYKRGDRLDGDEGKGSKQNVTEVFKSKN